MEKLMYPGSLHNHTQYSNLRIRDCIIKEADLINYSIELGHEVVAITDHECICNSIKIEKIKNKIKESNPNFKVILGNEIYLTRNGLNADNFIKDIDKYYHFILLAKDTIGHQQIRELSTRAWKRSYMARGMRRVPTYYQDLFDIIGRNPGHVIGSTACLGGALPTQILRGTSDDKLAIWTQQMISIFGKDNFFYELQPSKNAEQIKVNKWLVSHCDKFGISYIITTDSHYLKKEDRLIHKAYLNAQNGEREVDDFYATTYLMGTDELESFFTYLTREQIDRAYQTILTIKNMCEDYSLLKPLKIPQLKWKPIKSSAYNYEKAFTLMPELKKFYESQYESDKYLVNAILDGINTHNDLQCQEAYAEINACLADTWESSEVNKARWSAYFLNLQNIIDVCWDAGTLVGPSRGSGGGFILLYTLGITQINPLREKTRCYRWRLTVKSKAS